MSTREELHRLVDAVPDERLPALEEIVRLASGTNMSWEQATRLHELLRHYSDAADIAAGPVRQFASAGTLSAEPDLAARSEEILRNEPGTAA